VNIEAAVPPAFQTLDSKVDGVPLDEDESTFWNGQRRWLLWPLIFYMFYAQASTCDEYFVAAIKVCVEKFRIPEDVAGATLMALGCNGPELFTNFIAIFITHSDVGVGTIVGSELFNLLAIVGGSVYVTPRKDLPLELNKVTFIRDCFFYALSIVALGWAMQDSVITSTEAYSLGGCAVVFVLSVCFTNWFVKQVLKRPDLLPEEPTPLEPGTVRISVVHNNRMHDSHSASWNVKELHTDGHGLTCGEVGSRERQTSKQKTVRTSSMPVVRTLSSSANRARLNRRQSMAVALLEVEDDEIAWTDVVAAHDSENAKMPVFTVEYKGEFGRVMTLQVEAASEDEKQGYLAAIRSHTKGHRQSLWVDFAARELETFVDKEVPCTSRLSHVLCFPVEIALHITMDWCDPKQPEKAHLWYCAFTLSMMWLGVFSYLMCAAADALHASFGISTGVLGITVCAVGTSFPNFWASVLMAHEGRSAMAIANALGSNVQNVFIALAIPWIVATSVSPTNEFVIKASGIFSSVMWMGGTLLVLFGFAVSNGFKLDKKHGVLFFLIYFGYVIYGCATAK